VRHGLTGSDALKIAETFTHLITETDEIDLHKEWIASSRHPMFPKASVTHSNQDIDKSGDATQLNIRDELVTCPITPIRGTGEEEMDLNLAQQSGRTGCKNLLEERIHKAN
jgi:hypothetical protein